MPARLASVLLLLLGVGCQSLKVETEYDRATDMSGYRTWSWYGQPAPTGNERLDDPVIQNRVRMAVERELAERGYQQRLEGEVDFQVAYTLTVKTRLDSVGLSRRYGYSPGDSWGPGGGGHQMTVEYDQGTLVLDIIDAPQQKLVFRGAAERRVSENPTPESSRKHIRAATAAILDEFPPD
jgi:hypothetical protein